MIQKTNPDNLEDKAKKKINHLIQKSRILAYKPIQIAEALYHFRCKTGLHKEWGSKIENYFLKDKPNRDILNRDSKKWRDKVTTHLFGRVSTSSARYQDNVFDENAIDQDILRVLYEENMRERVGSVERFIYLRLKQRIDLIQGIRASIILTSPTKFNVKQFLSNFDAQRELSSLTGTIYEIIVYSLFQTITDGFHDAKVTITIPKEKNREIRTQFANILDPLFSTPQVGSLEQPHDLRIYRAGVTNAADHGLDMFTNFGPIIQVKHKNLEERKLYDNDPSKIKRESDLEKIVKRVGGDQVIVVCCKLMPKAQQEYRKADWRKNCHVLEWQDIEVGYNQCLQGDLGTPLLKNLCKNFDSEFPQGSEPRERTNGNTDATPTQSRFNKLCAEDQRQYNISDWKVADRRWEVTQ